MQNESQEDKGRPQILVSIIIPVFNEEKSIIKLLMLVRNQNVAGFTFEIIVVDDGSRDKTYPLLVAHPELYTRLIQLSKNSGKGAAVKAGLKAAIGEFILFQDADLEYNPKDYPQLLMPIRIYSADVVMGSRFLASQCTRVVYFWHKVGNWVMTFLFNILNNTTFTDIYSCYLVFRRELLNPNELKKEGWQQQAEILSIIIPRSKIHYEIPISYHGRTYGEDKKIRPKHAFAVILAIFMGRLRRKEIIRGF